ncbi:MAG TPA: VWA domain-containing protein [Pyrinomonadaceae bacterium]|nr:VWA domain-containing protein [Pyrinomonadaceae bacterium]
MKSKSKRKAANFLNLLCLFVITFAFYVSLFSQEKERPKIIDFGSSLKKKNKSKEKDNKPEKNKSEEELIQIESNLVVNEILVLNEKGNSIKGLKKEDFIVKEDGELQKIESFSLGSETVIPRSIVLIIDHSTSLLPYIETSVDAAKLLIDKLNPQDRIAIVTDNVELLADFTRDRKQLKEKLDELKNNVAVKKVGRSAQFSALYAVLNELFTKEDALPVIIFQTDGDELALLKDSVVSNGLQNSSQIPLFGINWSKRDFSLSDILIATEKKGATVYTIYPGLRLVGFSEEEQLRRTRRDLNNMYNAVKKINGKTPPGNPSDDNLLVINTAKTTLQKQLVLADVARFSGGWADFIEVPEDANIVYSRILNAVESRYIIGYYPTNEMKNGKRRKINIEVRNHPEYTIWGRKTYFASETEK